MAGLLPSESCCPRRRLGGHHGGMQGGASGASGRCIGASVRGSSSVRSSWKEPDHASRRVRKLLKLKLGCSTQQVGGWGEGGHRGWGGEGDHTGWGGDHRSAILKLVVCRVQLSALPAHGTCAWCSPRRRAPPPTVPLSAATRRRTGSWRWSTRTSGPRREGKHESKAFRTCWCHRQRKQQVSFVC